MSEKRGRIYPERPLVGVGAVVLNGDDVLLIRRAKQPRRGQWSLPGGAQKIGETLLDAIRREVREEAGIAVRVLGLIDVVDSITRDAEGQVAYHYTLVDFAAEWQGGELQAGGDADAARWVPPARLASYELWSETLRVIGLAQDRYRKDGG